MHCDLGGETHHLEPGDLLLIAPTARLHILPPAECDNWTWDWVACHPPAQWGALLNWPTRAPHIVRLPEEDLRDRAVQAMDDLRHWWHCGLSQRRALCLNALERLLLIVDAAGGLPAERRRIDPRIRYAILHLQQNISRPLSVPALAAQVRLSASRFAHLFTEETGVSPMRFLDNLRLEQARQLLLADHQSVQAVALQVGFKDPFHFSRRFSERYGQAPSHWRRQALGGG
ncbi:MAG: helix-turn-helix domain-containing protein, partial [Planctomycetota bacterium]